MQENLSDSPLEGLAERIYFLNEKLSNIFKKYEGLLVKKDTLEQICEKLQNENKELRKQLQENSIKKENFTTKLVSIKADSYISVREKFLLIETVKKEIKNLDSCIAKITIVN